MCVLVILFYPSVASASGANDHISPPEIKIGGFLASPKQVSAFSGLKSQGKAPESTIGRVYCILQFDGPVSPDALSEMVNSGIKIIEYIPKHSYLVGLPADIYGNIQEGFQKRPAGVARILPYQAFMKLDDKATRRAEAAFTDQKAKQGLLKAALRQKPVVLGQKNTDITVLLFDEEDPAMFADWASKAGAKIIASDTFGERSKIRMIIPAELLPIISNHTAVRWIESTPDWKLFNNIAANNSMNDVRDVWNNHALRGQGQRVAVADTGLDRGFISGSSLHQDFHDGLGGSRVIEILDTAGDGNKSDTHGHGTHVSGTVLGNGTMSGANPAASTYPPGSFAGMAPEANLVVQALMNNSTGALVLPTNLGNLFEAVRTPYNTYIHSNSWGSGEAGAYTSYSQDVDHYVWNYDKFLPVFAAGNEGVDADANGVIDLFSVSSPATAKNCITVGASEHLRPGSGAYTFPYGSGWPFHYSAEPIKSDYLSDNPNGMAAFSSRGPCLDGRRKPELVAPGTNVISTRSLASGAGTIWGAYDSNYCYGGGTSMATPQIAGIAALVRQYFMDGNYPGISTPSAALIKAVLANGATDLHPGQYFSPQEIPARPSNVAGWGRPDLEDSLFDNASLKHVFIDEPLGLSTGGEVDYYVNVGSAASPLKVTLAWSDYPGSLVYGGGLVNDLDLNIFTPNNTPVYPNNASQRGPSRVMTYTYNTVTYALSVDNGKGYAVRFTPAEYPYYLDAAKITVYNPTSTTGSYAFSVRVYSMDGNGQPGALLRVASANAVLYGQDLSVVTVPFTPLTVNSGSFFIEFRAGSSSPNLVSSNSSPITVGNDWYFNGSSWSPNANDASQDICIDAVGHLNDYVTQNDRVNNIEGIDIASPQTGVYRIRVSGHNVPVGPQKFALVISGDVQLNIGPNFDQIQASPSRAVSGDEVLLTFQSSQTLLGNPNVTINSNPASFVSYQGGFYTFSYPVQAADPEGFATINISGTNTMGMPGSASNSGALLIDQLTSPGYPFPREQILCSGETLQICVSASGSGTLTYQWRKNGQIVPGATSSCYSKTDVTPLDAGYYSCVVSNDCGSIITKGALVVVAACKSIPEAKLEPNNQPATIKGRPVTVSFGNIYYIEELSRMAGLRVLWSGSALSEGYTVDVSGTMKTNSDGERFLDADLAIPGHSSPLLPLGMNNKFLGGADFFYDQQTGAGQQGFSLPYTLNNIGLFARTWGKVTATGSGFFYINDGANLDDGSGIIGVKVLSPMLIQYPPVNSLIQVTGIISCYKQGNDLHRLFLLRSEGDIVYLQ